MVVIRVAAPGSFKGEARPAARLQIEQIQRCRAIRCWCRSCGKRPSLHSSSTHYGGSIIRQTRHEILLITRGLRCDTRAAIDAPCALPAHFRVVVVPDGEPRTKPRALELRVAVTHGDFVVVYDAEECPEPDQFRRAVAEFRRESGQSRLPAGSPQHLQPARKLADAAVHHRIYGAVRLHPADARAFELPVPLGGTSNHFPRAILEEVGGWDATTSPRTPISASGWRVQAGMSACSGRRRGRRRRRLRRAGSAQRKRWLKGWMQPILGPHARAAAAVAAAGAQTLHRLPGADGGAFVLVLLHPWFYVFAIFDLAGAAPLFSAGASGVMWEIALFNLIAGYLSAVALGRAALRHRRHSIGAWIWWVPVYWLAISIAAYRAIFQLVAAPYHWEKTEHRGLAPDPPDRSAVEQVSTAG